MTLLINWTILNCPDFIIGSNCFYVKYWIFWWLLRIFLFIFFIYCWVDIISRTKIAKDWSLVWFCKENWKNSEPLWKLASESCSICSINCGQIRLFTPCWSVFANKIRKIHSFCSIFHKKLVKISGHKPKYFKMKRVLLNWRSAWSVNFEHPRFLIGIRTQSLSKFHRGRGKYSIFLPF